MDGGGRGKSYDDEGKIFFNKMCEEIRDDRAENGENFDRQYFLKYEIKNGNSKCHGNAGNDGKSDEEIECYYDLESPVKCRKTSAGVGSLDPHDGGNNNDNILNDTNNRNMVRVGNEMVEARNVTEM